MHVSELEAATQESREILQDAPELFEPKNKSQFDSSWEARTLTHAPVFSSHIKVDKIDVEER